MAKIPLWVKPGSTADALDWDPWRKSWVVNCRAPPSGGKANRAVLELMADWLGLPPSLVRWTKAGTSRAKVLSADGISEEEATRRLNSHRTQTESPKPPPP